MLRQRYILFLRTNIRHMHGSAQLHSTTTKSNPSIRYTNTILPHTQSHRFIITLNKALQYTNTILSHITMSTTVPDIKVHNIKSRQPNKFYPTRMSVPNDKINWSVEWPEYKPPEFTDSKAAAHSPDPHDCKDINDIANRPTYEHNGKLLIDPHTNRPLNPYGRTGLSGRGKLYYWGPNHAADPIVTKYDSNKRLCVAIIKRGDNGVLALPGGMIDKGEDSIDTAKREFIEEAGNVKEADKQKFTDTMTEVYSKGYQGVIYKGYIDESRATDNAWIESVAHHWHVPDHLANDLHLISGDDAVDVKWLSIDTDGFNELHGNHRDIVLRAKQLFEQKQKNK